MAVRRVRTNFSPRHTVAAVMLLADVVGVERLRETGPPAVAIELVERGKKGFSRHDVHIDARLCMVPKFIFERQLCAIQLSDSALLWIELSNCSGISDVICHYVLSASVFWISYRNTVPSSTTWSNSHSTIGV